MADKEPTKMPQISVKTIGFPAKEIRKLVEEKPGLHFIARMGGIAIESFSGVGKNGEWHGLKGIFSLINRNGETFTSTVAFPPSNILKKTLDRLSHGEAEVEFTADIFATASDKVASGYAFQCEPVISEAAAKKMEAITARVIGGKLPLMLAAPADKSKKSA